MSAQNNLKKPAFTKTMLGYTPKEVDQYIDYVTERYAAVSRDVLELKRRVARLQLGLDPIDSAPKEPAAKQGLSDDAMDRLRVMIESEKRRHEEAMSALLCFVEAQSRREAAPRKAPEEESAMPEDPEDPENGFVLLPDDGDGAIISEEDTDWADTLGRLVDGAENIGDSEKFADGNAENFDDSAKSADAGEEYADAEAVFAAPISGAYLENSTVKSGEPAKNPAEISVPASASKTEERKKTPAELAEALDFYSDSTVPDGESFDPMSLAKNSSAMHRHPTLQDFMRPIDSEERPKK